MALTQRYLTPELMNEIQTRFADIQSALVDAGYTSPAIITEPISWNYLPSKIKELFNQQETNTQKVDLTVDWLNPYSGIFEWQKSVGMIFNHINRWFLWAEYNESVIAGQEQKQQYLYSTENEANSTLEQIYDSSGEPIRTLEGYF